MLKKILFITLILNVSLAADYKIDADHSTIGFKIRHLGISKVPGKFVTFSGAFSYDPANVASGKTEAIINVGSIDTSNTKRDEHLESADFFDIAKFPEIKFVSTKVIGTDPEAFQVEGDFTLHGITKKVVLDVVHEGSAKDLYGNEREGFTASTKINRRDYGLTWNKLIETGSLVVGDEVEVTLEIEGIKNK